MGSFLQRILTYVVNMFPGMIVAAILCLCLRPRRKRRLRARGLVSGGLREAGLLCFALFSGGMAALTLLPEPTWFSAGLHGYWLPLFPDWTLPVRYRVNLLPFSQGDSLLNLLGNVIMFVPFGFFAALLWRGFSWRRALGTGLGITLCVECWQLLVGRFFDVDDLLLNTLGVLLGYWLWRLLRRLAPQFTRRFHCRKAVSQ